jgi:NAD kinase
MKILAVKKDHCKKAQEALLKLLHITKEKNIQVLLQEKDFVKGNTEIFTDQRVDLGIALGGDGTMLRLSSLIQKYQKAPRVASFSLGTLGFLLPLSILCRFNIQN